MLVYEGLLLLLLLLLFLLLVEGELVVLRVWVVLEGGLLVVLEGWSWWRWLDRRSRLHAPVLDDLEGWLRWGVVSWEVGLESRRGWGRVDR